MVECWLIGSLEGGRSRLASSVGWVVVRLINCMVSVLVGRLVGWWMSLLNCLLLLYWKVLSWSVGCLVGDWLFSCQ